MPRRHDTTCFLTHHDATTQTDPANTTTDTTTQTDVANSTETKSIFAPPGTTYDTPFSFGATPNGDFAHDPSASSSGQDQPARPLHEIIQPLAEFFAKPLDSSTDIDDWHRACAAAGHVDDDYDDDDIDGGDIDESYDSKVTTIVPWGPNDRYRHAVIEVGGLRGLVVEKRYDRMANEISYLCEMADEEVDIFYEAEMPKIVVQQAAQPASKRGRHKRRR